MNGAPIAMNSWYIVAQIHLYIVFWAVFYCMQGKAKWIAPMTVTILTIAVMLMYCAAGYDSYWYLSGLAFPVGVWYASENEDICKHIEKSYSLCMCIVASIFVLFSAMPGVIAGFGNLMDIVYPVCRNISSAAFAVAIALALKKIQIKSQIWTYLGSISLEIYLLHGLMILCFKNKCDTEAVWTLVVLSTSILMAMVAEMINKRIALLIRK